jgi:hypothetical protein
MLCGWLPVQALPGGQETDFILVSCAGATAPPASSAAAVDEAESEELEGTPAASGVSGAQALSLKRRAESALKGTGLGYTIVRPGPLLEEPGGYKALVFDQVCFEFWVCALFWVLCIQNHLLHAWSLLPPQLG